MFSWMMVKLELILYISLQPVPVFIDAVSFFLMFGQCVLLMYVIFLAYSKFIQEKKKIPTSEIRVEDIKNSVIEIENANSVKEVPEEEVENNIVEVENSGEIESESAEASNEDTINNKEEIIDEEEVKNEDKDILINNL